VAGRGPGNNEVYAYLGGGRVMHHKTAGGYPLETRYGRC
jgi:hypothetical protein